jgi:hypothetical protein
MTSAFRALEAWGHEQIDGGRLVMDVIAHVLGADVTPAGFLAVAVDLLLSHIGGPNKDLIPFIASPELLKLDWNRFTHDRTGLGHIENRDDNIAAGAVTNDALRARHSRETCLSWEAARFLFNDSLAQELRERLSTQLLRLPDAHPNGSDRTSSPRWQVEHTLRLLDPNNWQEAQVDLEDGSRATTRQYVEPAEEASILQPLRGTSGANLAEMKTMMLVVEAVLDPEKRTEDLVNQGLEWALRQDADGFTESEDDFRQAQRWCAVVAVAALVAASSDHHSSLDWATPVLRRAAADASAGVRDLGASQVRYSAVGLSVFGWVKLLAGGHPYALHQLLDLASRSQPALISAFSLVMDELTKSCEGLPRSLLRIGLMASIYPHRDWKRPEAFEAAEGRRRERLQSTIAAEEQWLAGSAAEPPWPKLPKVRHIRKRRGIRVGTELGDQTQARSAGWFNHEIGGAWLRAIEKSDVIRASAWPMQFVKRYRAFANFAWGGGLAADVELSDLRTAWLEPFERLRLRMSLDLSSDDFERAVAMPLVRLPDQRFLEAIETVIPTADSLFWDEKRLPLAPLVRLRERACERLKRCHLWKWQRSERSDSIPRELAGPVRGLFFHTPISFGTARCYLPTAAESLGATLPALTDLALDAPGLSFVADLVMSDFERARTWAPAELLLGVAEGWQRTRADEAMFWRDHGLPPGLPMVHRPTGLRIPLRCRIHGQAPNSHRQPCSSRGP